MAKKKRPNRRESGNPARRVAEEAARREEHLRIVTEREGDPRYVQVQHSPEGRVLTFAEENPATEVLRESIESQKEAFRDKFGRDPSPDDPLFFDPDADEPQFMTAERGEAMFAEIREEMAEAGMDPAHLYAWEQTGYLVTDENEHTFTAHEIQTYEDLVVEYRETHGR